MEIIIILLGLLAAFIAIWLVAYLIKQIFPDRFSTDDLPQMIIWGADYDPDINDCQGQADTIRYRREKEQPRIRQKQIKGFGRKYANR